MAAAKPAKRLATTTGDVILKASGRGYLIVWNGKDAGMFTPLHPGNFDNAVKVIRNALRAYQTKG